MCRGGLWLHFPSPLASQTLATIFTAELRAHSLTISVAPPRQPADTHRRPRHCVAAASAALLIDDYRPSVTIDLHVTCVSAAPLGSRLEVESTVEQVGKSMLFTSCRIFSLGEGGERTLVTTGLHTKKAVGHGQIVGSPKPKL